MGKRTVAPVIGSNVGIVPAFLVVAKVAKVGDLLLPLKKQFLLPLNFPAFMGDGAIATGASRIAEVGVCSRSKEQMLWMRAESSCCCYR